MPDRSDAQTGGRESAAPRYSRAEWRELMGDDGTGHCKGCGNPLDRINPDCEVCYRALCAFMDEEVDSDGQPF